MDNRDLAVPEGRVKPNWEYDARTLAWDFGAYLAYGAGTGTEFWLLTRIAYSRLYGPSGAYPRDADRRLDWRAG